MIKTITKQWLKKHGACSESQEAWDKQKNHDTLTTIKRIKKSNPQWCNWLITRLMNHRQQVQYAIYAAELVIDLYETKYPNDDRPRKAINAAKEYLKAKTKKQKADAANAAYAAAHAAADAARAAAYAAADAAYAAADAANAAYAAAHAAADAARAAAYAEMLQKILTYGIKLLRASHE